ncbi:MAG: hypothetical protein GC160_08900 [Acidobacteria bacterium]|nr:hypothetical protein [Acidobacteriota bacterium]
MAKTSTGEILGRYALSLAVVTPVLLFARMQLRYLLAARPEADWGVLLRARLLATGATAAILALAAQVWLPSETAALLALVGLSRAVEDVGDLLYGLRQRSHQWSRIAASQILRGLGGAATVIAVSLLTGRFDTGLAANLIWQLGLTLALDARGLRWPSGSWRAAVGTLGECWTLGAAAAVVSLNGNLPRYALEASVGAAAVGHYAALSQVALLGNLPVQAMGVAALARLGARAEQGRGPFLRLTAGLAAVSVAIGLAGVAASWQFGARLLALLYSPEIEALAASLTWMMAGALCTFLTAVFGYSLVALGERRAQLGAFGASGLVGLAACWALIPEHGVPGAAAANLLCWLAAATFSGAALWIRCKSLPVAISDCPAEEASSTLNGCSAPVRSSCSSAL